jgi:hypothetical protein
LKGIKTYSIVILILLSLIKIQAQPIPVELMMGNNYAVVDLSFSKNLSSESRFGFFHMNTEQFYYKETEKNSFILQDLLYIETFTNLRVTGGAAYGKGGFNPTAGLQYVYSGKKLLFLCAPRINIRSDYSYDIMTIFQYKPVINDRMNLFTRIKLLNVFNNKSNIRSYQWFRIGLEMKNVQFGLALNLDEYGPNPSFERSLGLFVRKEIF